MKSNYFCHLLRDLFCTELKKCSGEVAVITGGARGIGSEVVKKLLLCDMHIVIGKQLTLLFLCLQLSYTKSGDLKKNNPKIFANFNIY